MILFRGRADWVERSITSLSLICVRHTVSTRMSLILGLYAYGWLKCAIITYQYYVSKNLSKSIIKSWNVDANKSIYSLAVSISILMCQ